MSKREELQAKIQAAKDAERKARKDRSDKEFEEIADLLISNPSHSLVEVEEAPVDLPGFVVLRIPKKAEFNKFRSTLWGSDLEAKSKAGIDLASVCVVYPSRDRYMALVEALPGVADRCGNVARSMAEGEVRDEAKK